MAQVLKLVLSAFLVGTRMAPVATHSIMRPVIGAAAASISLYRPRLVLLFFRLAGKKIGGFLGLAITDSIPSPNI